MITRIAHSFIAPVWMAGWLLFSAISCSLHPPVKEVLIRAEVLKEDLSILRTTLEEGHPGLYWYTDKTAMDHYFDSLSKQIDRDMTAFDFFSFLLPAIATVRCSHTNIHLSPGSIANATKLTKFLPYEFYCRDRRLFIREDLQNSGHAGEEIISINKVPVALIIDTLLHSLPADGFNETYKYYLLSLGAFREGYAAYFKKSGPVTLETRKTGISSTKYFPTELITPQDLRAANRVHAPWLTLTFKNDIQTAILTLNSFEVGTNRFRDSLGGIIKSIADQKATRLIIDIRENGGGNNENVAELFSYIAASSFRHLKRAEMTAGDFTYARYFTNRRIPDRRSAIAAGNGRFLVNARYSGTAYRRPAPAAGFKGRVVLLISGHTSSAASEFAALVRSHKNALILGEETGGGYYGGTGGVYIHLVLPGSGIETRIPAVRIFNDVEQDSILQPRGRGTLPDVPVIPTIEDILSRRDIQLDAAIKQITKIP